MELLIVTGMSGAGKSHTANVLEDMGYYCVDNIPPAIIPSLVDLSLRGGNPLSKAAIVTDIRGGDMFDDISDVLDRISKQNIDYKIIFLDANDEVLIRRYKENRRKHPLANEISSLAHAVSKEREKLERIRQMADYVIDTSFISSAQLKEKLSGIICNGMSDALSLEFKSFGFKYGTDTEADLVFDVRCLPNPFYDEELKFKTGLDREVRDYVFSTDEGKVFFEKLLDFVNFAVPLYAKEGKSSLVIAFGCTGGKHRSVTFAEVFAGEFSAQKYNCRVSHRDIHKG